MWDLKELLDHASKDFENSKVTYQENLKQINKIDAFSDLYHLNGERKTKLRLSELAINPALNPKTVERIIGKNCLMDLSYFKKGIEVAKTVCRIVSPKGDFYTPWGTGFLIGPNLLMTNNHVLKNMEDAKILLAEFEYENDLEDNMGESFFFRFDPELFFITNTALDYTVIGLESIASNNHNKKLADYKWNHLKATKDKIMKGEAVSIIQHPLGLPKKIAIRENQIVEIKEKFIHYTTDTQPGSSGSLVANDQWEIIALHRSGVPEEDENGNYKLTTGGIYKTKADEPFINWIANQGVLIDRIIEDIDSCELSNEQQLKIKRNLLVNFQLSKERDEYVLPKRNLKKNAG